MNKQDSLSVFFSKRYRLTLAAFIILSALAAGAVFALSYMKYLPQTAEESSSIAKVESIAFGIDEASASKERPENFEHQSCFVKLDSHEEILKYPALGCELEPGSEVTVYSTSDSVRIAPEFFQETSSAITIYLWLSLALLLIGVGIAISTLFIKATKVNEESDVQLQH